TQLKVRITRCLAGDRQSPRNGNLRWLCAPRWGSCYEYGGGKCSCAICAYCFATSYGVLRLPEYCAIGGEKFLLWFYGAAAAEAKCIERGLCVHAAVRRYCRRSYAKPRR